MQPKPSDSASPPRDPGGVVIWVTGRPAAGKTTFARIARREFMRRGHVCGLLDGDAVREAIVPPHGYSKEGHDAFYATLARLAAMLCQQGLIVLVPATGHRAVYRSLARELAGAFIEVYVDTPPDECERRLAIEPSREPSSPAPFEEPSEPDVVAHGGRDEKAMRCLLELVSRISR